jgi:hypothetical protein
MLRGMPRLRANHQRARPVRPHTLPPHCGGVLLGSPATAVILGGGGHAGMAEQRVHGFLLRSLTTLVILHCAVI